VIPGIIMTPARIELRNERMHRQWFILRHYVPLHCNDSTK